MKKLLTNLLQSFTTGDSGFSARKLSAFTGVATAIYITIHELPQDAKLHALYAWQLFVLVALGIVTVEQIIKFKNGTQPETTSSN